jgi:hypothetical protein
MGQVQELKAQWNILSMGLASCKSSTVLNCCLSPKFIFKQIHHKFTIIINVMTH